jgi:hypothetical protein
MIRRLWPWVALVLSASACGDAAPTSPARAGEPWFEDVAGARGLDFTHVSGHDGEHHWMPEIMGGGGALFDADQDGDLDAYLVQGGHLVRERRRGETHQLFENTGGGSFRDVSATSGAALDGYGMGVAAGDADGDGDTDLYVTHVGPNALLLNQGGLKFVERSQGVAHPGWGTSCGFFDADRDGDLDLFVANYLDWSFEGELPCLNALSQRDYCSPKNYKTPAKGVFYANDGAGGFTDESEASGIASKRGTGLGVAFGDLDANGLLDVFVANDGMANHLWKNLGARKFQESALVAGCGVDSSGQEKAGMGVVLCDLDRDLDLDLLVCNLAGESDSVYLNERGLFSDRTALAGLGPVSKPFTRFGVGVFDFDHDGELDLFEATGRVQAASEPTARDVYAEENLVFRGAGPGKFSELAPRGGVAAALVFAARGAIFGDIDGDGSVDVLVVNRDAPAQLLRNVAKKRGSWLGLRVLERSGAAALGATVELPLARGRERHEVASAFSYLSASDPCVHVGLGAEREAPEVLVRWVDGAEERFGPLAASQVHVLRRGTGR